MKECPVCELCFEDDVLFCPYDQSKTRLSLPNGRLIADRYLLEKRIGRGAMGQVYLATDQNLGTRRVAVKTVRQDLLNSDDLQEGEAIIRFEREAMSAASIRHPNIVDVTDFGESDNGVFFLVMEYVEGETLQKLLRREGTLSVKKAVGLLKQIGEGIEAAHEAGVLHRDLKPANIFLMRKHKSGDGFIKVGDFGLAKIINQTVTDITSKATPSTRGIIGTPEFMSPEQMQPELGVDERSDLYALGVIAYLMLGGKTPFSGDLMQLVMQKIMHSPPPLSNLRSDIPKKLDAVIMSALGTNPKNRPASVGEWIESLENSIRDVQDIGKLNTNRLVILAPIGAEVYVDDERKGSIGSSGRLILSTVPAGQHVLRVSKIGERDDERVIEIREDTDEQVIQAQLKQMRGENGINASASTSGNSRRSNPSSIIPQIVECVDCRSRFAEGVKFCGRCGKRTFTGINKAPEKSDFNCPFCEMSMPVDSNFCGRCGRNLAFPEQNNYLNNKRQIDSRDTEGKECVRCNQRYAFNVKFCGRCGNNL